MNYIKTYNEFLNESFGPIPNRNLPKFDGLDKMLNQYSTNGTYVINFRTDPEYGYQHIKLLQLWIPNKRGKGGQYGLAIWDTEKKEFIEEPAPYDDYEVTIDRIETKYGFEHEMEVKEGIKTWATGIMAALSLFSSVAMGGNIKVSGKGTSKTERDAIQMAKNDAMNQIKTKIGGNGGDENQTFTMKSGKYTNLNIQQDKNGNYIVTIDLETDSSDVSIINYEILPANQAKIFLNDIINMGYSGDDKENINSFINKYSEQYNFKISKMNQQQSNEVGEFSLKLSKQMKNGNLVYCVVTPISK